MKAYDDVEQAWKYYIGSGKGRSEEADIQQIMAVGQKYDSLHWIAELEEQPKPREYLREFYEAGPAKVQESSETLLTGMGVYAARILAAIKGVPKTDEAILLMLFEDAVGV